MHKVWTTPAGKRSTLYADMLQQVHLLIAGAAGSGKSTVVNGIMHTALYHSPASTQFILIDPKGTELSAYEHLPHTIRYAQTIDDCVDALRMGLKLSQDRFAEMKRRKEKTYTGSDVYIIIDELMFLMNRPVIKKVAMSLLQDILVIARAGRVHVIACTQSPTSQTGLPVNLRCNFDSRLALRTSTAQDSRNIIGVRGCENFPNPTLAHKASGIYMHGGEFDFCESLTKIEEKEINRLITYWKEHRKPRIKWH